jgi:ABC-type multidrug transport system fused ATPase/permease subunit
MREIVSIARQGIRELTRKGRKVLVGYLIALIAIASLDGLALFLVSQLFDSEVTSIGPSDPTGSKVTLLIAIVFLFVSRSALSTFSSWVSLKEFSNQEVEIGQKRLRAIHNSPLEKRLELNESDFFTAIDRAPTSLMQNLLLAVTNICAESVTALVILGVVLVMQPTTAIVALLYFVSMAMFQHKLLSATQSRSGQNLFASGNSTYELISDYFQMNKLMQVNASKTFESVLGDQRQELALARAKLAFVSSLPRYFMESMLAIGFLVVTGFTWLLEGESEVIPALVIFAAAGFRLLPIVNRIQGLVLTAIGALPLARLATESAAEDKRGTSNIFAESPLNADNMIEVREVDFAYPSSRTPVLKGINLSFKQGLQYAIVGPSGSGKTTLIDVCLGLLTPQKGEVLWNLQDSKDSFGYVPQDTHISSASIAGNVALEWDASAVDLDKVRQSISAAHLDEVFDSNLEDEKLREDLNRMSGGQRQRLGLARAIYRDSKILVLDEATSALDASTESKVMETVKSLRGSTTVIIVAHRLSTIKDADEVIYLDNGTVLGIGTFQELQKSLPQFDEQVRLGLLTSEDS